MRMSFVILSEPFSTTLEFMLKSDSRQVLRYKIGAGQAGRSGVWERRGAGDLSATWPMMD